MNSKKNNERIVDEIFSTYDNMCGIATWGWNDLWSKLAWSKHLTRKWKQMDVMWILSPWATHIINWKPEQIINPLTKNMQRFVWSGQKQISFHDTSIPEYIKHHYPNVRNAYELSVKRWNKATHQELDKFVKKQGYDALIWTDAWWDIFARIYKDNDVISPIMDHSMLHILWETNIDSLIWEFGMWTDGEISDISWVLKNLEDLKALIEMWVFTQEDHIVKELPKIYQHFLENNLRQWHTVPRTVETFNALTSITDQHHIYQQIWKEKRSTYRSVFLDKKYFKKYLLVDPKILHQDRKHTTSKWFDSLEEHYIYLKTTNENWKNEMDCLIDTVGNTLMLCISNNFSDKTRWEICLAGYNKFIQTQTKNLLMYKKDLTSIPTIHLQKEEINEKIVKFSK